jgi:hypothetical protein
MMNGKMKKGAKLEKEEERGQIKGEWKVKWEKAKYEERKPKRAHEGLNNKTSHIRGKIISERG